jgi:hypothetical protein
MHVKVDLLNSICTIQASEGEVLKSSSYTVVMGVVSHRSPISRELGVSIHRGAAWLAVTHTSMSQDIQHILSLREEQTIISAFNNDT